jgi:hypothetical protein
MMTKYRGFVLEKVYLPGSTFIIRRGRVFDRKPRATDLAYVQILDPLDNGRRLWRAATVITAKASIDDFLIRMGWERNEEELK